MSNLFAIFVHPEPQHKGYGAGPEPQRVQGKYGQKWQKGKI